MDTSPIIEPAFVCIKANSPNNLLFFRGLGQNDCSEKLKAVFPQYNLYLFQPTAFYGKSLAPEQLKELLERFLTTHAIEQFSVAAFSLGGRMATWVALHFAPYIEKLLLFAPDGVLANPWYNAATSAYGRGLFRYMLNPEKNNLNPLLQVANYLGVEKKRLEAVKIFTQQAQYRHATLNEWLLYQHLRLSEKQKKQLFQNTQFPIHIQIGKRDRLLPYQDFEALAQLYPQIQLSLSDQTHMGVWNTLQPI
jgi:pimeloyl-ACP methyl ester carboxylesterase